MGKEGKKGGDTNLGSQRSFDIPQNFGVRPHRALCFDKVVKKVAREFRNETAINCEDIV